MEIFILIIEEKNDIGLNTNMVLSGGSSIAQWLACLLPDPAALDSILSITNFFSEENILNVAAVNQRCSWERIVNICLKMLIKLIKYWLVTS